MSNENDTTNDTESTGGVTVERANVPARDLLEAVAASTDPENHPVATTDTVVRHVHQTEDPLRIQGGLVSDALLDLSRQGFVGHDQIGDRDVWFAPRLEAFAEATSEAEGSDHE